jgi:hypothetical protein
MVITVQNFLKLVGFKFQILSRVHAFVILRSCGCHEAMSFNELWQALQNEGKISFAVKKILDYQVGIKTAVSLRQISQNQ